MTVKSRGNLPFFMIGGVLLGTIMALVILAGDFSVRRPAQVGPTPRPASLLTGEPAPNFQTVTANGENISLNDFAGNALAINFWATWCGPCIVEMPALQAAHTTHAADGFLVLAVNAGETPQTVEEFMLDNELTFPALLDQDGTIVDLYNVQFFPTTYWIDQNGTVIDRYLGAMSTTIMEGYLHELLAAS